MKAPHDAHEPGAIRLSIHDDGDGPALAIECDTPAPQSEGGPITMRIMENVDRLGPDDEIWLSLSQSGGQGTSTSLLVAMRIADLDALLTNLTALRNEARGQGLLIGTRS